MSYLKRCLIPISLLSDCVFSTPPSRSLEWRTGTTPPWYLDSCFVAGYKGDDIFLMNENSKYKYNTKSETYTELDSDRNWDYDRTLKSQAYTQIDDQLYFGELDVIDLETETPYTLGGYTWNVPQDSSFWCMASTKLEVPESVASQDSTFYGNIDIDLSNVDLTGIDLSALNASKNIYSFLYVTGGASTTTVTAQFDIWNVNTASQVRGPDMPSVREYHTCNVVNNTLYLIGGALDNDEKTDSIIYIDISDMSDIDNWQWMELDAKLSVPRAGLRSVVFEDWIYVIGGWNSDSNDGLDTVDIIDTRDGTITTGNALQQGVAFGGAINVNDILYVFGGSDIYLIDDDTDNGIGEEVMQYARLPIEFEPSDAWYASTSVTILYFLLNAILIIIISISVYCAGENKSIKALAKGIWDRKGIYGEAIAHLFDTASDIGVLIDWGLLAYDGYAYDVDMKSLFWTSIAFQIFYRTMMCCFAYATPGGVSRAEEPTFCVDAPLACIDMYILKAVYSSLKNDDTETNPRQSSIQLIEALLESSPQIMLQSVYLAAGFFDVVLRENSNPTLVVLSLISSIYSISSKFAAFDKPTVIEEAQDLNFKMKWPCVSFLYMLRVIWRACYIIARLFLMVLLWVVISGFTFGIYFGVLTLVWIIMMCCVPKENDSITYYLCCVVCIAHPVTRDTNANCYHFFEMIFFMIVVSVFYFSENICDSMPELICNPNRSISGDGNSITKRFFIAAWCMMILDFVLFFVMRKMDVFAEDIMLDDVFELFINGMEYDPTVSYKKKPTAAGDDKKETGNPPQETEMES